jgi:hypothetical protein
MCLSTPPSMRLRRAARTLRELPPAIGLMMTATKHGPGGCSCWPILLRTDGTLKDPQQNHRTQRHHQTHGLPCRALLPRRHPLTPCCRAEYGWTRQTKNRLQLPLVAHPGKSRSQGHVQAVFTVGRDPNRLHCTTSEALVKPYA